MSESKNCKYLLLLTLPSSSTKRKLINFECKVHSEDNVARSKRAAYRAPDRAPTTDRLYWARYSQQQHTQINLGGVQQQSQNRQVGNEFSVFYLRDNLSCFLFTSRALIQFKLLNQNYDFPVSKPKRTSFEWYHPRGILKRNWMLKHLHVLPSVVVLFQDIEWNDPQWSEKQMQCASLVQSLKNSLQVSFDMTFMKFINNN